MAILDYSGILQRGGAFNGIEKQQGIRKGFQNLEMNKLALEQGRENLDLQRANRQAAMAQQEQAKLLKQEADAVYQSGDPNAIADLHMKNPALGKQVLESRGIVDEIGRKRVSDRFSRVFSAANPREVLIQEVEAGEAAGLDMTQSKEILAADLPDDEIRRRASIALATVDPEKQQALSKASQEGQPEAITEYQQELISSKQVDQDLRRDELELKKLESQQRAVKNDLDREKAGLLIQEKRQQVETKKAEQASNLTASLTASKGLIDTIKDIEKNYTEILSGYSGRSWVPSLTDSGVDADVAFDQLVNSLTLDNLKLMSGPLTDTDVAILRSAASGLEKGMSKKKLETRLGVIKGVVTKSIESAQKRINSLGINPDDNGLTGKGGNLDSVPISQFKGQGSTENARSEADILAEYGIKQ